MISKNNTFLFKKEMIRLPNKMEEMVEGYMCKHGLQLTGCGFWIVLLTVWDDL